MRTLRTRPLQIRELVAAAVEHLEAASLVGLAKRYPPTRLTATVAGGDYRSLSPFREVVAAELQRAYMELGARDGFALLAPELACELADGGGEGVGQPPRFASGFPAGERRASWAPPTDESRTRLSRGAVAGACFELLFAAARHGTARQSRYLVSLEPELPGALHSLADRAEVVGPLVGVPDRSDGDPTRFARLAAAARRMARNGRDRLLWAPEGGLVVGRLAELAHLVPEEAPGNLSGRHFALVRADDETAELQVLDLGSTNGTHLDGRRLAPWEPTPLRLPGRIEIGSEGALTVEVHPLEAAPT